MDNESFNRYSIIEEKNKREIILLRGSGCTWRKCRFCNYHLDSSKNSEENFILNKKELEKVTGIYKKLEIINSGSFVELSEKTFELIEKIVIEKNIKELHFECHWSNRNEVSSLKTRFNRLGVNVIVKIGIETFDFNFRENYFVKGIDTDNPEEIAKYFDECCLLFGVEGQYLESMTYDIETALKYFKRVCINIMQENGTSIKPEPKVIEIFKDYIFPKYKDDVRVDILMENTDFGVGGVTENAK